MSDVSITDLVAEARRNLSNVTNNPVHSIDLDLYGDVLATLESVTAPTEPELEALLARWDDTERPDGWNSGDEHHLATLVIDALRSASQPVNVEVTDEMVEKAMVAAIQSADIPTGMRGTLLGATPTIRERVDLDDVVRVVLTAVLGGGDHE